VDTVSKEGSSIKTPGFHTGERRILRGKGRLQVACGGGSGSFSVRLLPERMIEGGMKLCIIPKVVRGGVTRAPWFSDPRWGGGGGVGGMGFSPWGGKNRKSFSNCQNGCFIRPAHEQEISCCHGTTKEKN